MSRGREAANKKYYSPYWDDTLDPLIPDKGFLIYKNMTQSEFFEKMIELQRQQNDLISMALFPNGIHTKGFSIEKIIDTIEDSAVEIINEIRAIGYNE